MSFALISNPVRSLSVCFCLYLSDFMIKVIEVMDSSQQKTLRGHDAPVLSVTFDPSDEFVVSETDFSFKSMPDSYLSSLFVHSYT